MAGNVYSTYDLAKEKAEERMKELETDIFICRTKFNSGEEYTLKTRDELISHASFIYMVQLPFHHRFANRDNAIREASIFEKKMDRKVMIEKHTYEENGYNIFSHYSLCLT